MELKMKRGGDGVAGAALEKRFERVRLSSGGVSGNEMRLLMAFKARFSVLGNGNEAIKREGGKSRMRGGEEGGSGTRVDWETPKPNPAAAGPNGLPPACSRRRFQPSV